MAQDEDSLACPGTDQKVHVPSYYICTLNTLLFERFKFNEFSESPIFR